MRLFNEEEEYNKHLRSEDALMKAVGFCIVGLRYYFCIRSFLIGDALL